MDYGPKISEVIELLTKIKEEKGDLQVISFEIDEDGVYIAPADFELMRVGTETGEEIEVVGLLSDAMLEMGEEQEDLNVEDLLTEMKGKYDEDKN